MLRGTLTCGTMLSERLLTQPELESGVGDSTILQHSGRVAQLVEQRTENPCVGGSIPSLATTSLLAAVALQDLQPCLQAGMEILRSDDAK